VGAYTKSEAPSEFIDQLNTVETQSDECFETLRLLREPQNLATWAALTLFVERLESVRSQMGKFHAAAINLGRTGSLLLDRIQKLGLKRFAPRSKFRMTPALRGAAIEGLNTAHNYSSFIHSFTSWHKNGSVAEIVSPTRVRFTEVGGPRDRQVRALQKGFRPGALATTRAADSPPLSLSPEADRRFQQILDASQPSGSFGVVYPEPIDLYRELFQTYEERHTTLFRRDLSLDFVVYSLKEFRSAFRTERTLLSSRIALLPMESGPLISPQYRSNGQNPLQMD
jgi:hypothetical protein